MPTPTSTPVGAGGPCPGSDNVCVSGAICCNGTCAYPGGEPCTDYRECCFGVCQGGFCTAGTPTPTPVGAGGPCPGSGNVCVSGAICCNGTCAYPGGEPCTDYRECCSGVCQGGFCTAGTSTPTTTPTQISV